MKEEKFCEANGIKSITMIKIRERTWKSRVSPIKMETEEERRGKLKLKEKDCNRVSPQKKRTKMNPKMRTDEKLKVSERKRKI